VYAANKAAWRPLKLQRTAAVNEKYNQSDEHDGVRADGTTYGRGPWFADNLTASLRSGQRGKQFARTGESTNVYEVVTPSGRSIALPAGTCWRVSSERLREMTADHRITYGKNGSSRPCLKRFLAEMTDVGLTAKSVWRHDEVGENRHATNEAKKLNSQDPFSTPKPEGLLHRVLALATEPGDLVLDSFAGSGTTGAVAHKMKRRWIMVELGPHALSHIVPRMRSVIDGTDAGGVSGPLEWRGGGGFRYYRIAPSLLERDKWGNWVVSRKYNGPMLAEALCKLEGFKYAPDATDFWIHGKSSGSDYIYVTDQRLSADQLQYISDRVGPERTLLVCCRAWRGRLENFPNLTLKKIPQAVLGKCEWGRDDYSLNIRDLPAEPVDAEAENNPRAIVLRRTRGRPAVQDLPLFSKAKKGGDA
jgi:adenine-specific DNA-methyltransferase